MWDFLSPGFSSVLNVDLNTGPILFLNVTWTTEFSCLPPCLSFCWFSSNQTVLCNRIYCISQLASLFSFLLSVCLSVSFINLLPVWCSPFVILLFQILLCLRGLSCHIFLRDDDNLLCRCNDIRCKANQSRVQRLSTSLPSSAAKTWQSCLGWAAPTDIKPDYEEMGSISHASCH